MRPALHVFRILLLIVDGREPVPARGRTQRDVDLAVHFLVREGYLERTERGYRATGQGHRYVRATRGF